MDRVLQALKNMVITLFVKGVLCLVFPGEGQYPLDNSYTFTLVTRAHSIYISQCDFSGFTRYFIKIFSKSAGVNILAVSNGSCTNKSLSPVTKNSA